MEWSWWVTSQEKGTGNYGGMFILPDPIVMNIYAIIDNNKP